MRTEYEYLLRYGLVFLLGLSALAPLYWIITPLTVGVVWGILNSVSQTTLLGETTLVFQGQYISLIPACIAGAAYYLLIICACTIPLSWTKRWKVLGVSCGLFFSGNVLRILLTTYFITLNQKLFDVTHALFWYAGSTVLVIICWGVAATHYNIRAIPIVTDIKALIKGIRGTR